ncbi:MAG TPA: C40 family peptidase [Candidatus Faecalicoccus intestinipullorum]|nr:C40 family peptidase [Candidatus Faecalicoccus intestinipullorum]
MNYIEEHGKKVAAVLCVASCFPVVAAVYAMETEPGWHGDRYINTDTTVATGWQEIEGKSYYFDESGSVDQKTTKKATVATVSSTVAEEVQTNVSQTTKEVVQEEVKAVEEQKAQEALVEPTVVEEAVVQEPVQVVEESTAAVSQPTYTEEVTEPVVETPAAEQTPVTETQPVEEQAPVTDTQPAEEQTPAADQTPAVDQTPAEDTNTGAVNSNLNARIASSAQQLVGVTDGMWCTQVVQQALAMAGVSDAMQLWPDEYIYYGYYTDSPQAGNLVYYDNGGRGVDHIAIYIGNGMAVHGNFYTSEGTPQTIISSVYNGGGGTPQFIQVVR